MRVPSVSARGRTDQTSGSPAVIFRSGVEKAGIVLIPGFTGEASSSWGNFPRLLTEDPDLKSWGIYGLDYASNRTVDIPRMWEADPNISLLAQYFCSEMTMGPFADCNILAFVAHSMGGLVVQRALLDDSTLQSRTSNLIMFGTPSIGINKSRIGSLFKRQLRDMGADSDFIIALRSDWVKQFPRRTPFRLTAIGGDRDEFVSHISSLDPFPRDVCAVVPGNHSTIVRPENSKTSNYQVVARAICGDSGEASYVDSARIALERGEFRAARQKLLPNFDQLDDAALVDLAMALDGLGEGEEALRILDDVYDHGVLSSADAAGTLGGRVKRRWILERRASDLERAKELYRWGLSEAERLDDHAQAYYHAINLAFLDVVSAAATDDPYATCQAMAEKALNHCALAPETNWRFATEGEAYLMLNDLGRSEIAYRRAVELSEPRQLTSTRNQALQLADRMLPPSDINTLRTWFSRVPAELV